MEFCFENLGRFKDAKLFLNGLTVVAGTNSSGKTTIGKAIYAKTKCEIALLDNLIQQKLDIVQRLIHRLMTLSLMHDSSELDSSLANIEDSYKKQIDHIWKMLRQSRYNDGEDSLHIIEKFLQLIDNKQIYNFLSQYGGIEIKNNFPEMIEVLESPINFDDSPTNRKLIEYAFNAEFENQIANLSLGECKVRVFSKNSSFDFIGNTCDKFFIGQPAFQNIIYLDDVYVFDNIQQSTYFREDRYDTLRVRGYSESRNHLYSFYANHRQDLMNLLYNISQPKKKSVAEGIRMDKIHSEANMIFREILRGQVQFSKEDKRFVYHEVSVNSLPIS